jgi:hypothetical protein
MQRLGNGERDDGGKRMQPVRTANDIQMKWLIRLSRAVRRISPIVAVMHDGLRNRYGKSQRLTSAPSVSLLSSGFHDQ